MPDPVPVASNLLESKFLGFSVRRLAESMALPVAPCALLYTIGFPILVTFPLFVIGVGVGALIFVKTPPGQRPLRYAHAVVRYRSSSNVYVWTPSKALEHDLTSGVRQDAWLTHPPIQAWLPPIQMARRPQPRTAPPQEGRRPGNGV